MNITFSDNKLKKYANDDKQAIKKLGQKRAALFKRRLDDLLDAETLEDVRHLPGHYHNYPESGKVNGLVIWIIRTD